jgi:hypothetical protein
MRNNEKLGLLVVRESDFGGKILDTNIAPAAYPLCGDLKLAAAHALRTWVACESAIHHRSDDKKFCQPSRPKEKLATENGNECAPQPHTGDDTGSALTYRVNSTKRRPLCALRRNPTHSSP